MVEGTASDQELRVILNLFLHDPRGFVVITTEPQIPFHLRLDRWMLQQLEQRRPGRSVVDSEIIYDDLE